MFPPSYQHNGFVASYEVWHMIYSYAFLAPMNQRVLNRLSKEQKISG